MLAPLWRDNSSLYVATDWTGWWNIYQIGLSGEPPQALYPADEEFAGALWELGARPFALLGDGRLAVRHGRGGATLGLLDPETSELTDLDLPFNEILIGVAASGSVIACVAGAPLEPDSLVKVDIASGEYTVLRTELSELPDRRFLPVPAQVELEGPYGRVVHALIYPPSNPEVTGAGGRAAAVHRVGARRADQPRDRAAQPGEGVLHQPGHRDHRRELRRVDRLRPAVPEPAEPRVGHRRRRRRQGGGPVAGQGRARGRGQARHPGRFGGRLDGAGSRHHRRGAATRCSVRPSSYYGVADLRKFSEHTHDFESRYLDGLIGPLPGFDTVYAERAPLGHVNKNTCPVLLLQGLDDPVVPPEQSEVDRRRPGGARDQARLHRVRGRVARIPPGRLDDHLAGGGTVLLRADLRVQAAERAGAEARPTGVR